MKYAPLLLMLLVLAPAARAAEDDLAAAISRYRTALGTQDASARLEAFADAKRRFERALDRGAGQNADLYANLGNAALGAESIGEAMWAYRQALRMDPSHARARANVAHVRNNLPAWVPRPEDEGVLDSFFFWRKTMPHGTRGVVGAVCFLLFTLLLAGFIAKGIRWMRWAAILPLLFWIALVVVPWMEGFSAQNEAVITAREAILRTADAAGAPPKMLDPVPGGTEVTILETRGDWVRIRLADARDGWVRTSQVRSLAPA